MRHLLTAAVTASRRALLVDRQHGDNIADLLEAPYGFDRRTGVPRPLESLTNLRSDQRAPARQLREWHRHLQATAAGSTDSEKAKSAFEQMQYELAYTVFHRLCALRMAEVRGYVQPCVSDGLQSAGFRLYMQFAGDALGSAEAAYPVFLERMFDEFAWDLPAVFDRRTPASAIFPGPRTLHAILAALDNPAMDPVWEEPETLGWIFQDFNDPQERQAMRAAGAPRNVRELAVRNQFFTPRWVVEFLTDNTLGRLWFDVTGGQTDLADYCRYLAVRDADPAGAGPRDPRDLKVLDPACGSGHFLVYAFELLERIYLEAWDRQLPAPKGKEPIWRDYPDRDAFRAEVPVLILEHNLYGIDIDSRCIQEAALTMWLRGQKSFKDQGLRPAQRPRVRRVNLVCPHPMAGSPALLEEFLGDLKPAVLGRLVRALIDRVGEMGILQRTDTALAEVVAQVKKEFQDWKRNTQEYEGEMFDQFRKPKQAALGDFVELRKLADDETFWHEAEDLVRDALGKLADHGEGDHLRRRLFADDMRQGLEFFDIARLRFDAILMNPPFGESSRGTKAVLDLAYPVAENYLEAMFFERTLEMLSPRGRVGAITNRTWMTLVTMESFRVQIFGRKGAVELGADLGSFVLDAMVETAAVVLARHATPDTQSNWVRLLKTRRKNATLLDAVASIRRGEAHANAFQVAARQFEGLPARVYGYWMSPQLIGLHHTEASISSVAEIVVGTQTSDDFRFVRLLWEVSAAGLGLNRAWARFAKGGEYRLYFDDVHLAIRWLSEGAELAGYRAAYIRNSQFFGRAGVTWPSQTSSNFGPRILPAKIAFSHAGPGTFTFGDDRGLLVLAVFVSLPFRLLLSVRLGAGDDRPGSAARRYETGIVKGVPWPRIAEVDVAPLRSMAAVAVTIARIGQIEDDKTGETTSAFAVPPILVAGAPSLADATRTRVAAREDRVARLAAIQAEIDTLVADAYGFSARDRQVMDEELEPALARLPGTTVIDPDLFRAAYLSKLALDGSQLPGGLDAESDVRVEHRRGRQQTLRTEASLCRLFDAPPERIANIRRELKLLRPEDLQRAAADIISYAVGVAFGRWDIRLWQHSEWIATWKDPFGAMPACPIGQLVGADGLPATPGSIASPAWRRAWTDASTLPEGIIGDTVTSADYPLPVAWDGWLVDDAPAETRLDDFLTRVGGVLEFLFGDDRPTWEHDICDALGVRTLAEWLRAPANFFADHLSRYSKSRRKAPIYWPIATQGGRLTLWVYGPRFDSRMVAALINWLRRSCDGLRDELEATDRALAEATGRQATELRDKAALLRTEQRERQELRDRLAELDHRGYRPHPDDGFAVTLSPLAFAFRHTPWRTYLEETWAGLEGEKLDWSHLAMQFWPARVREKCKTDKSLAIAHGLEELFVMPEPKGKGKGKRKEGTVATPAAAAQGVQQGLLGWRGEGQ